MICHTIWSNGGQLSLLFLNRRRFVTKNFEVVKKAVVECPITYSSYKLKMKTEANSPDEYFDNLPEERKAAMAKLRQVILENLPSGFEETISYGMIGYVVPKSIYPNGYHCDPKLPLPFVNLASQKNFIAIYHMGLYADKELMEWYVTEYAKRFPKKPDMGKSCLRFTKPELIPFDLIADLMKKMTVERWIEIWESNIQPKKR